MRYFSLSVKDLVKFKGEIRAEKMGYDVAQAATDNPRSYKAFYTKKKSPEKFYLDRGSYR